MSPLSVEEKADRKDLHALLVFKAGSLEGLFNVPHVCNAFFVTGTLLP
jgi:hypothetical protein